MTKDELLTGDSDSGKKFPLLWPDEVENGFIEMEAGASETGWREAVCLDFLSL